MPDEATIDVFGRRMVALALDCESVDVEQVRVARGAPEALRREIAAACRRAGVRLERGPVTRVRALSNAPRHDQGVAARIRLRRLVAVEDFAQSAGERARLLALDGIANPSNVGMIARSVAAAGLDGLLWPRGGTPRIDGLAVKASAGALLQCPIVRCDALAAGLDVLRSAGFRAIGLEASAPLALAAHAPPARAVYVVGSETGGLSDPVRARLDARVAIPLAQGVESLNAAIAAALVAFHASGALRAQ